jgi:glucose-1-phosphate cytidylyltransferase
MKAVILAGGYGTRLSEETTIRPKPMVNIGQQPILWHIMKIYSTYGINEFIICSGYKGHIIKEYFANYHLRMSNVTFDLCKNKMEIHKNDAEKWRVTIVDTGDKTMTGGRIKRAKDFIGGESFCLSYGDGVADVNIKSLIEFHQEQDTLVTLTAVQPPGRFGAFTLESDNSMIRSFSEKPPGDGGTAWINGGFFVIEPAAIDYIIGDLAVWEQEPLERLAQDGELSAYRHSGFWQSMETLRDKNVLKDLWKSGDAPWKIW